MCASAPMVDIQSGTAEIRQSEEKTKMDENTVQKYNVRICYAWRP